MQMVATVNTELWASGTRLDVRAGDVRRRHLIMLTQKVLPLTSRFSFDPFNNPMQQQFLFQERVSQKPEVTQRASDRAEILIQAASTQAQCWALNARRWFGITFRRFRFFKAGNLLAFQRLEAA